MSRTFSTNSGSGDSLNVSVRCGCSPKARQMRVTVLWLNPQRAAMPRVLQCVASRGFVSNVNRTTSSTAASPTVRGAPGRGSSSRPSTRFVMKRLRHLPTVCFVSRSSRATCVLVLAPAARSTMRARCAKACAVVGRRAHRSSVARSSSLSCSFGVGRPVRMSVLLSPVRTPKADLLFHELQTQETSTALKKAPSGAPETWDLHEYTEVAAHAGLIKDDTAAVARQVRGFRNLIHPGRAQRLAQRCDRGTALAALAAVEFVVRDLTPNP